MSDFQWWTLAILISGLWSSWLMYRTAIYAIDRKLPPHPERWQKDQ